jgi:hypothetical protein
MVGGGATGKTPAVPSLPGKLSVPHVATSTASRCDTPISVRELSNRARTPRLPSGVQSLKIGQHFDVPDVGSEERSRKRFRRCLDGLQGWIKVSVRGQPDGSVRVTKVGEWSNLRA